MFVACIFVILSFVPVAGESWGGNHQFSVDKLKHSEFFGSFDSSSLERTIQGNSFYDMRPYHDRPEWTKSGSCCIMHHSLNSHEGRLFSASTSVQPYRINSFRAARQVQFTHPQQRSDAFLQYPVRFHSGVVRVPTLWKDSHHKQQIMLRRFFHDNKAYNTLLELHYRQQSLLLQFECKASCMQTVVIRIETCSCVGSLPTRQNSPLTSTDLNSVGLKNKATVSSAFSMGMCFHSCVHPHRLMCLKKRWNGHFLRLVVLIVPFHKDENHESLWNAVSRCCSKTPYSCTVLMGNRDERHGVKRMLFVLDGASHDFSLGFLFPLTLYEHGNKTIHVCSCDTGLKPKTCMQDVLINSISSKHDNHSTKEVTSNSHLVKNISRWRQILHKDLVTINNHLSITAIARSTWSALGILTLWIARVLSRFYTRKVVILKSCKRVRGRRVWRRHRKQSLGHSLHCVIATCTQTHYDTIGGPFNEILQNQAVVHYRLNVCIPKRIACCRNPKRFEKVFVGNNTFKRDIPLSHLCQKRLFRDPNRLDHSLGDKDQSLNKWSSNGIAKSCNSMRLRKDCNFKKPLRRRIAYRGVRVGEAKVPGPESLDIGVFNPTQLYGKEDDVIAWGQGIYCAAETSVTSVTLKLLRPKFAQKGFHSVWSEPVEPIQPKFSQIRGKASGTAIISTFPIRQFHEPITSAIEDTCRFVDGVVQLGPNCVAYVASIYGAASSSIALDPLAITNHLFNFAAERAVAFKGPAIIAGDFNCYMNELGGWNKLLQNGWMDSAELDGTLHNRDPQPTSKDAVRKSFILMNGVLSATLQSCRTCEDHLFPVHPLLLAKCSLRNVISPSLQWVLPKSVDNHIFDEDLLESTASDFVTKHGEDFQKAINDSVEKAASWMAKAVEHSWKESCVDCEGNPCNLTQGYFGRDKHQPLKYKSPSVPVVRKARDGDFDPGLGQPSVEIRRHTRQLRRIESLYSQLSASESRTTHESVEKCKQLWNAILEATGFTKSFSFWAYTKLRMFVPKNMPPKQYVLELKNVFRKWHQAELNKFFIHKMKNRRKSVLLDIAKGGSKCFEEVRDPAPLNQSFVVQNLQFRVKYTAWPKKGKTCIYVYDADQLDIHFPIRFQGQCANIVKLVGNLVHLDRPLRLKNLHLLLEQQQTTADPREMHKRTFKAWNEHWQRDCKDPNDDDWDGVIPLLQHINPIPDMRFEDFSIDLWKRHLKAVKPKTARGGCGFSAKEMTNFPVAILEWLFEIYRCCERNTSWPKNWVLARVSMLAKTAKPTTPFDARPITVFSILYRQWARIRSKQILNHMATYMPREVSMATCRVPADVAAAYIATNVENAINENRLLAGLGIDLKRCFNTLPRWPLILAMARMGIPKQYIQGWTNMLDSMQRTLWMGSCQSDPEHSTTGAPEGCGFSVVAMAVMSWWQAKVMKAKEKSVDTFTYADNWNYVAEQTRAIIRAVDILKNFVNCMRMEISPNKSWLWATTARGRKELQNIQVDHETIPVVTSFSDLGCDVQYAKSQKKPKQNKRWDKTTRLCKRIQVSKIPRGYKEHIVVASGLSGAIFGAPITYVPKTKWKTLRTSMAQSLRMATAGASSWLTMGCSLKDPQLKSLGFTLQFWKRFLRMFPNMREVFNNSMQSNGLSKVGPTACLKKTLHDAGWVVISPNIIQHSITGIQIDWFLASRKYLWFVLERQWTFRISQAVEHRKDWQPGAVDFHMFNQITTHRNFRDTWILRTAASGKHYTNDIVCKYADVQATCPFCDQRDGKEHRLWWCSAFVKIRQKYGQTLRKVRNMTNNLGSYALPPLQDSITASLPHECTQIVSIQVPVYSEVDRYIFLDGTAFGQEYKDLTISAWAVTEANFNQCNYRLCDKGFVPGLDHSSYRGEVMAMIKGLDIIYRGTMYTDCEAALNIFEQLQTCRKNHQTFPVIDHEDLWHLVWLHLCQRPSGCIKICKVKSHQVESSIDNPHERWKAAGNNFTDLEAKSVVTLHPIYRQVTTAVNKRKQLAQVTRSYHDYICEIADHSFTLLKEKRKCSRKEAEQQLIRPNFCNLIPNRVKPSSSIMPWKDLPRYCPYGETFYNRFAEWYTTVRWPIDTVGGTLGYISVLELYFNFVVCTGTETPISNEKRGKPAQYKLLDENVLLQSKTWSLGQHTRVWCLFWNWCLKSGVFEHPPVKTSNRYLEHVGYSLQSICFEGRPALKHGEATYQTMWDYFHQPEGRRKTTAAALRPLPKPGSMGDVE